MVCNVVQRNDQKYTLSYIEGGYNSKTVFENYEDLEMAKQIAENIKNNYTGVRILVRELVNFEWVNIGVIDYSIAKKPVWVSVL